MALPLRSTGGPPIGSHSAIEWPCSERAGGDADRSKRSTRVCCPASVSTLECIVAAPRDPQTSRDTHQAAGAVRLARAVCRWIPLIRDTAAFVGEWNARVVALARRRHPPQPLLGDDRDPVAGEIDWSGGARGSSGGPVAVPTAQRGGRRHQVLTPRATGRRDDPSPAAWWRNLRPDRHVNEFRAKPVRQPRLTFGL